LRQSGVLAAAALHALDHHVPGLAKDHALAQRLAAGLQGLPGMHVVSAQTNIVFLDVDHGLAPALLAHLRQDGVLATGMALLRLVTHLDVDAAGIDQALANMQAFAATHAEHLRAQP
jgi:threonine aldolase